jgi:RNA polymerase sigma-70 factor (ECF subfamily)
MFSFLPSMLMPSTHNKQPPPEQVMADYIMHKDKKAITALYNTFADDMYHYLLTLSEPSTAQDIVQKTWLKVIEKPHSYHTSGSLKAWLFTMARNALIDELRKTKRWTELDEQHEEVSVFTPPKFENKGNIQALFDEALMLLPFQQREAFCLQQEGFSLSDIALMTDSKQETIKTRLRYAKTKLKELLEHANDNA